MDKEKLENSKFLLQDETSGSAAWSIIFAYKWSPGELYWMKSNGSKVILLRPGDFIEHERFEKFRSGNMNITFNSIVDISYMENGIRIFEELKTANDLKGDKEERKSLIRKRFLYWSAPYFWNGKQDVTFLELISLYTRVFYELDPASHLTFANLPIPLQMRSLTLASLVSSTAMIVGHTDFKFLQDIFHLCLFFDLSLADESYTYLFEEVLEKERLEVGSGEKFLNEKSKSNKGDVLRMHPAKSYQQAKELIGKMIENKQLLKLIKIHHETLDGKGFPDGLNINELNDIEKIVIAVGKSLPQKVDILNKYSKESLILDFILGDGNLADVLVRLKSQVVSSYNSISEDDKEYLEVIGF
jgi:hypothetical protein